MSVRRLFRLGVRRPDRLANDVDEEIRLHIELRVEQLRRQGYAPDEALAEARRRFGLDGNARSRLLETVRRSESRLARAQWLDALRHDAVFALRQLARAPGFALAAVTMLALGIGANAMMFGVVDRLLLRAPAHVMRPSELTRLYFERHASGWGGRIGPMSNYPTLETLRANLRGAAGVAAMFPGTHIVGEGEGARQRRVLHATGDFFQLLGTRPALGRLLTPDDDRLPDGRTVAVLAHAYWKSDFGASPSAIGKSVLVNGIRYEIVGVAAEGFTGVDLEPVALYVPLSAITSRQWGMRDWYTVTRNSWIRLIARARPGVSFSRLEAEATAIVNAAARDSTSVDHGARVIASSIIQAREPGDSEQRDRGVVAAGLAAVAAIVLLIACANVANLLLLRGIARRREIAVRVALGASGGRLVRQLLTESALLALAGGAAGVLMASWGGSVVRSVLLPDVDWSGGGVADHRLLLFTLAGTAITAVFMGVLPAVHAASRDVVSGLKAGAGEWSRRSRLRGWLLVTQTSLSVLLLACAGLFARSLQRIHSLDYGYQPDRVLVVAANLPPSVSVSEELATYDRMLERARRLPTVEHAALTTTTPFWSSSAADLAIPGFDSLARLDDHFPLINAVSSDYFAATGLRVSSGRVFTAADGHGAPRVAVVNEAMARRIWKDASPLGRCIKVGGDTMPCSEVVGVVANLIQNDLRQREVLQYYVPIAQRQAESFTMRTLLVRPRGDAAAEIEPLRRAMSDEAPSALFMDVRLLQSLVDPEIRPWTLGATMFGVFGALALVIAALGLYSVVGYEVARRAHEMGIRTALGARASDLLRLVMVGGVRIAAIGVGLGVVITLVGGEWLQPLLFEVRARDPFVIGGVTLTLLGAAMVASLHPAIRAARANPLDALRSE
jgi:predicted permease